MSWAETGLEGAAAGEVGENAVGLKVGLKFSGMGCQRNNQGLGVNLCVGTETQAEDWGMNLPVYGRSRKGPLGRRSP